MKKILSILLTLAAVLLLSLPALASSYADVSDGAWYADAVEYVTEHGLMDAAADGAFAPDDNAPRGIVAEALWRVAGKPQAAKAASFPDVGADDGNRDAIDWAAEAGVINGYDDGRFHGDDLVTREQFAAMLWRAAGRPDSDGDVRFADSDTIAVYAAAAAAWSQANGLITGMPGNLFAPRANISRAMVAAILMRYDKMVKAEAPAASSEPKVLVAYFSATNNTAKVAAQIADATGAVLYQITPETPYTSADLSYGNSSSRTSIEQNDATARPAVTGKVEHMDDYDVVFVGYPIWWGQAPKIMYTFMESYDFSGKTVVPFCTSGSSGIGSSATNLQTSASEANWLAGSRFSGSASRDSIVGWLNGLDLNIAVK